MYCMDVSELLVLFVFFAVLLRLFMFRNASYHWSLELVSFFFL